MLWGRKPKPKNETEMLLQALKGAKQHSEKVQIARHRKLSVSQWRRLLDRRIWIALGLILVAVLADGVRRENREFEATLTALQGQASVATDEDANPVAAVVGTKLLDGNVLRTGEASTASLSFADGSLLVVGPEAQMTVRLLEYNRGGAWRSRAFYLKVGQIWATVSHNFGHGSEMKIYTPASVAAVRGTVFAMNQDRDGQKCDLACADGTVRASGLVGLPTNVPAGTRCSIERGQPAPLPTLYTRDEQQALGFGYGALWEPPPGASRLQTDEYAVCQFLNAPMTILGLGKCGWAFGAIDATRRSAALEALRRLNLHLSGTAEFPPVLNIATLEELNLAPQERDEILNQFDGCALTRYIAINGGKDFIIYARARDVARTMYKLTQIGVERVSAEEVQQVM
jgi:hypothetical protein